MPVVVQPIEPHIYHTRWQGVATRERFIEGARARLELADSSDDPYYLLIFDFSEAILATADLRIVRAQIEPSPRLVHLIYVGSPLLARMVNGVIHRPTAPNNNPIELYSDYTTAVARARTLRDEYERQRPPVVK